MIPVPAQSDREEGRRSQQFGAGGPWLGIVTKIVDDEGLGRVKVRFPLIGLESYWARIAAPWAGRGRGAYFPLQVEDEVLVVFCHGDPYIIGALWNGVDPALVDNRKENARHECVIRSGKGSTIRISDTDDAETVEVVDSHGNGIKIETSTNTVTIRSTGNVVISAPDGKIQLDAKSVEVTCSEDATFGAKNITASATGKLKLQGSDRVDIN